MYGYEYLQQFLKGSGIDYIDNDTLLKVQIADTPFYAFKSNTGFLQISVVCKAPEMPRHKLLELCNHMNHTWYITKFIHHDDDNSIWCSCELIPSAGMSQDDWKIVFSLLDQCADTVLEKMEKL